MTEESVNNADQNAGGSFFQYRKFDPREISAPSAARPMDADVVIESNCHE
jgi:hypothetical protein